MGSHDRSSDGDTLKERHGQVKNIKNINDKYLKSNIRVKIKNLLNISEI